MVTIELNPNPERRTIGIKQVAPRSPDLNNNILRACCGFAEAARRADVRNNVRELHFSNVAFHVTVQVLLPFLERYGGVESLELYKNNGAVRPSPGRPPPAHRGKGYVIFKRCESVYKITEGCTNDGRSWILPAPNVAFRPRIPNPTSGCLKVRHALTANDGSVFSYLPPSYTLWCLDTITDL